MKRTLSKLGLMLLAIILIIGNTITYSFAKTTEKNVEAGVVTISDEDFNTMVKTGEKVYLGDKTWAKIESFDEMASNISKSKGLSREDDKKIINFKD